MAIQLDSIETSEKKYVGKSQVKTECEIALNQDADVGRILSVTADASILNIEALTNEVRYRGEACFKVLYIAQNGKLMSVSCLNEFEGKVENNIINAFSTPFARANLMDAKVDSVNSSSIRLSGIVETNILVFNNNKYNCEIVEDENLFVQDKEIECNKVVSSAYEQIVLNKTIDLDTTPDAILSTNARVITTNVNSGTEYFSIEGKISLNLVYSVLENEKYIIKNAVKVFDFKEEVENNLIRPDSIIDVYANIKNCAITTELLENNVVNTNLPLDLTVVILEKQNYTVPVDSYHTVNEVTFEMESYQGVKNLFKKYLTERIDGQIVFNDEEYRLNNIFGTCGENVVVTNTFVQDEELHIEGIAQVNVIYSLDDELEQLHSIQAEMPFALKFKIDDLQSDDDVYAVIEILEISARQKKGKQIDLDALLGIEVYQTRQTKDAIIKKVLLKDQINFNEGNLQIYYAKVGETLWDIAKNLLVEPELVREQNPDLVFPLTNDEKIVLYFQR